MEKVTEKTGRKYGLREGYRGGDVSKGVRGYGRRSEGSASRKENCQKKQIVKVEE